LSKVSIDFQAELLLFLPVELPQQRLMSRASIFDFKVLAEAAAM